MTGVSGDVFPPCHLVEVRNATSHPGDFHSMWVLRVRGLDPAARGHVQQQLDRVPPVEHAALKPVRESVDRQQCWESRLEVAIWQHW